MTHSEGQPLRRPFSQEIADSLLATTPLSTSEYVDPDSLQEENGQVPGMNTDTFLDARMPADFDMDILSAEERQRLEGFKQRLLDTYALYRQDDISYARGCCRGNTRLVSRAEYEDIAQEVWEAYWKNAVLREMPFDGRPINEKYWLLRVTKYKFVNRLRWHNTKGSNEIPTEILEDHSGELSFEDEFSLARMGHGLATRVQLARDLLDGLNPRDREVLWRKYELEQTAEEIADDMGAASKAAVRVTVHRARQKVLARFAEKQRVYGTDRQGQKDLPVALGELIGRIIQGEDLSEDESPV